MNFQPILIERGRLAGALGRVPIMIGGLKWYTAPVAEEILSRINSLQSASEALATPLCNEYSRITELLLSARGGTAGGNKSTYPRSMVLIC